MTKNLTEALKEFVAAKGWADGTSVNVQISQDYILIKKGDSKPQYTLEKLIAQCDLNAPQNCDLADWERS